MDADFSNSANDSKDEKQHVIDPPKAAPRHTIKKSQSVITSVVSQCSSNNVVDSPFTNNVEQDEPLAAPRHKSKRRDEKSVSTVITIQEEEDSSSHAETSFSPIRKQHQAVK